MIWVIQAVRLIFHSAAFKGVVILSKSTQMSDKINAKEANHHYLLLKVFQLGRTSSTGACKPALLAEPREMHWVCSHV